MNNEEFNEAHKSLFLDTFTHEDEMRLKALKTQVSRLEQKRDAAKKSREKEFEVEYKLTGTSNLKSRY